MRVAIVTESFLPQVNGVVNSVLRVCEQLDRLGHRALVVAPGAGVDSYAGAEVVRTPSVPLPRYSAFRLAQPWPPLGRTLKEFAPDVVHLASPAALGAQASWTARQLGLPVVAVYQTDVAGFVARYGMAGAEQALWRYLRWVHGNAALTLAPSRHAVAALHRHGIERVRRWARGVDSARFSPAHRDVTWRSGVTAEDELVVGYVGRLAREKEVHLLAALRGCPRVRLVVVGDGPYRGALEAQLPGVRFLGQQTGAELGRTFASLDVFVHTGSSETFCQAAQEALASAVPVVAPAAGGLLDLVEPGVNGLLFPPGSGRGLREQVERLVADPALRAGMSAAARTSVVHRSWDTIGEELVGHYVDAIAGGSPPGGARRPSTLPTPRARTLQGAA